MSAAATAAGYLYASGRLRGRGAREQEHGHEQPEGKSQRHGERHGARKEVRVAVLPAREEARPAEKKVPKIAYRTRKRWSAE